MSSSPIVATANGARVRSCDQRMNAIRRQVARRSHGPRPALRPAHPNGGIVVAVRAQ
jgi:hypothetical protein